MIVRNEENVLERALLGVKDFADEIVIVDTGSTDNTMDIARKYTDRVYTFNWCDDFSKARNYAISLCSMEYFMWLDADDVVPDSTGEAIRELLSSDRQFDCVMMPYNIQFDSAGNPTFSYYRERICRNDERFRFVGAVHECITPSGNIIFLDHPIEHRKIGEGDPDRNIKIYENLRKSKKHFSARENFYYANELFYHSRYDEALKYYTKVLDDKDSYVENKISSCYNISKIYSLKGDAAKCREALAYSFSLDTPRGEGVCLMGDTYFDRRDYSRAIYWYSVGLITKCDTHTGAFHNMDYDQYIPAFMLGMCYYYIGDFKRAYEYNHLAVLAKPYDPAALDNEKLYHSKMQ